MQLHRGGSSGRLAGGAGPRAQQWRMRASGAAPRCPSLRRPDVAAAASPVAAPPGFDIRERMEWLKEDLTHLFDDKGVDPAGYDSKVEFLDPITKYDSVQGYLFNIKFLKLAFTPEFTLHDIRQTGDYEVTTRWTMTMRFSPARALGVAKFWDPEITFTGTSAYGFNPANGKINRHIDTWDSVKNQNFFSVEAFVDFLKQVGQRDTVPQGLEGPRYTLLRRTTDYQVRRYEPYVTAEAPLDGAAVAAAATSDGESGGDASSSSGGSGGGAVNPASAGLAAFKALAGYIFGGNAEGRKLRMTAPVLSDSGGAMRFVLGPSEVKDPSQAPTPAPGSAVRVAQRPGGDFAVRVFGGVATPRVCAEAEAALRAALLRDGLRPAPDGSWEVARYNDPGVPPARRRNEVLIPLEPGSFDLWA